MKLRPSFPVAAIVSALCFASTAAAQSAPPARPAPAQSVPAKPAQVATQPVPPEIDAAFKDWDIDKNGALSLQEFRNGWLMLRRAGEMQARLHEQFQKIDVNRNDAIDPGEYGNLVLVKQAGKSAPALSTFDTNKNQRLEFGEYVELVRQLSAPRQPAPARAP